VGAGGEALGLGVLPAERLDDQRAVERLVCDLRDARAQFLGAGEAGPSVAGVDRVQDDDARQEQHSD